MKVKQSLFHAKEYLRNNSINKDGCYALDAEVLLAHVLGCSRIYLLTNGELVLDESQLNTYNYLLKKKSLVYQLNI